VSAELLFYLGPIKVTNSILTAWIVTIILIVFCYLATRNMQMRPSGLQNFMEMVVQGIYNLTETVAGPRWVDKFFAIPATIFIFVLATNLFGLLIGLPLTGLGICEAEHHGEAAEEAHAEGEAEVEAEQTEATEGGGTGTCGPGEFIVPFFRAPAADLNFTFALALISQIAAQYFGILALGAAGYLSKFFVIQGITSAKTGGEYALGIINFFVGLIELMSEFIKVIAFTFRLFGNIFAGEVMLLVIMFLVPLLIVTPLIGFEIFVNVIQAFVFYILSVAFYTVAVSSHGGHEEEHH
jgi:F-type H+-transporting ATPase subunit a